MSWINAKTLLILSVALRAGFFCWGIYQDATMEPRFTDIDYMVFTDASRFVKQGMSPYERETYRYTPLLAWCLLPTAYGWFSFGKVLFCLGDLLAGYFILCILRLRGIRESRAVVYSSLWLLNPMVAAISARGSSEGLLGAMVAAFAWAVSANRLELAGLLNGLAVHFKIYPIIYTPAVMWALTRGEPTPYIPFGSFFNKDRIRFAIYSAISFVALTGTMYCIYGQEFLHHSYLHHLSRIDHRHNFSPYSTLLYMSSSPAATTATSAEVVTGGGWRMGVGRPEAWAFLPQLALSGVILPLKFARIDLIKTFFVQTFAFVTFNKVCTSQYFLWYLVFLPFFGPSVWSASGATKRAIAIKGGLWVVAQALWLQGAYLLEFLGQSTYYPQLLLSTIGFFAVNCWGLGSILDDIN